MLFSIVTMCRNAIIYAEFRVAKNFMIISLKNYASWKEFHNIYRIERCMVKKYCEETKM